MYKKTITYTDYNGVERTEDFYFNMTKTELTKLEVSEKFSFSGYLRTIVNAKEADKIMEAIAMMVDAAYGIKSDDGRRFMKSEEISRAFRETEAYDQFFYELCTDSEKALEFINSVLPKDVREAAEKEAASAPALAPVQ